MKPPKSPRGGSDFVFPGPIAPGRIKNLQDMSRDSSSPGGSKSHLHAPSRSMKMKKICSFLSFIALLWLVYDCTSMIIKGFHWAESHVDRESHWHMLLFFVLTIPFNLGLPIPLIHQVWAVAIGVFFRWRAFPILVAALSIGVPLPFLIGRRLARRTGGAQDSTSMETRLRVLMPKAFAYFAPLKRTIAAKPIRASFLIMWAPLPTSFLPFIVGFLIPPSDLSLRAFVSGALPSKLLHFACDVLVGIEAGSLASALDAHDLDLDNDLEPTRHGHAKLIAAGAMGLTISFVCVMVYSMHKALKEMKAKGEARDEGVALLDNVV